VLTNYQSSVELIAWYVFAFIALVKPDRERKLLKN
jgi:hypothetical protein